jgi:hypothetical protein
MEETLITSVSFAWRAFTLYRGRTSTGFSVVPDLQHPAAWRIYHRNGSRSELMSLSRARKAAVGLVQQGVGKRRRSPPKRRDPMTANRKTVH